jgi:hypothetical protein
LNNLFLEALRLCKNSDNSVVLPLDLLQIPLQDELVHTVDDVGDNFYQLDLLVVLVNQVLKLFLSLLLGQLDGLLL